MEIEHIGKCLSWLWENRKLPDIQKIIETDDNVLIFLKARDEFSIINQKVMQPELTVLELQEKIRQQKRQLAIANESLRGKNIALDAMHYVWCDGGCAGGTHRYDDIPPWECPKCHITTTKRYCSNCGVSGNSSYAEYKNPITEEIVQAAEYNTMRLRRWFVCANGRQRTINSEGKVTVREQLKPFTTSWYWKMLLWLADLSASRRRKRQMKQTAAHTEKRHEN